MCTRIVLYTGAVVHLERAAAAAVIMYKGVVVFVACAFTVVYRRCGVHKHRYAHMYIHMHTCTVVYTGDVVHT